MNIQERLKRSRETAGTSRALDSPSSPICSLHWQRQSQSQTYTDEGGSGK